MRTGKCYSMHSGMISRYRCSVFQSDDTSRREAGLLHAFVAFDSDEVFLESLAPVVRGRYRIYAVLSQQPFFWLDLTWHF